MPTLEILSAAAEEAEAAVDWYEKEQPGLGQQFRDALNAGLDLLENGLVTGSAMPGSLGEKGVRHLILRRFPYDIILLPTPAESLCSPSPIIRGGLDTGEPG